MPYIIPNNLLTPTEKVIKPYNCAMLAVEGPQIKGKINMEGLEIPYDSQFTSQMILNESAVNQPILYGFLGNNVTFLMIKADYRPNDPNWEIEADQYIEWYHTGSTVRQMGKLMILTGNSTNRIPQVYLNNPSTSQKVYLEIMVANQAQDDLTITSGLLQEVDFITGLYYNNIISDSVNGGSTALYITDIDDNIQLIIPYDNINTIERTVDGTYTLILGSDSEEKIQLQFLSEFNMLQAHSRISWVLEDPSTRSLTKAVPAIDADPPVISWTTSGSSTGYTSLPWTTGDTITKTYLNEYFITGVTDAVDGDISIYDTQVAIYEANSLVPLDEITSEGQYTLYFTVVDIAGNDNTQTKYAMTDTTPPVIIFNDVATGSTFPMSISNDTTSGTYITTGDTLIYTVDSVTDNVYSGLTITDVGIVISGDTCGGTCSGTTISNTGETLSVTYTLADYVGNIATYVKTMNTIT